MRALACALLMLVVVSCSSKKDEDEGCEFNGQEYELGDSWMVECNTCTCEEEGPACTLIACVDAGPRSCVAENTCPGPICGDLCCGAGEHCGPINDCRCGDGPACNDGDTCEAAGPVGEDGCGSVCCGASGPCPQ
jgi:hypothetical protein